MRLFPMSPLNSSAREKDLNTSIGNQSPVKSRETMKNIVNEQVKDLQTEMDKNGKMIKDLEHALQISRATVEDLEKQLTAKSQKCRLAEEKLGELEAKLEYKSSCTEEHVDEKEMKEAEGESINHQMNSSKSVAKEKEEIERLNQKIKELEPLMTDYFSTSKKLTDSDKKIKELENVLEDKNSQITELEGKLMKIDTEVGELQRKSKEKEEECEKLADRCEEIETLNDELKGMVDKTASDLQTKQQEIRVLSPKIDKLQKSSENEQQCIDSLKEELTEKLKEIEDLRFKLSNMKTAYKVKETALQEAVEKGNDYEFKNNEIEIENQELQKQVKDYTIKVEDLQYELEKHLKEVQTTGEELAVTGIEVKKSKRMIEELKVNVSDLESAVSEKKIELCEKDKIISEKSEEILSLRSEMEKRGNDKNEGQMADIMHENEKLKEFIKSLETQIDDLKKVKDDMQKEIDNKNNEISELKESIENLEENAMSMRQYLEEKENDVKELKGGQAVNEEKITHFEDKFAILEVKVSELAEKIDVKEAELQESHDKILKFEQMISDKDKENAALRESYEKLKENIGEENDNRLSDALLEVAELKSSVHTHKTLHHKDKGELEEALLTIENNRGEIEGVRKQMKSLKENETQLKERIAELENAIEKKATEFEEKSKCRIEEVESELKNKTEEVECAEKIVSEMKDLLKRRDEQLEELHNDLRNARKNIEQSNKDIESKHNLVADLKKQIQEKEMEIENLQTRLSDIEKQLEAEHEKLVELRLNNETIENSAVKSLTDQVEALEEQKKTEVIELNSKVEIAENENNKLRQEVNNMNEEKEKREKLLKDLNSRLEQLESTNTSIQSELSEAKKAKEVENELRSQLTLKEVECETLNLEVKVLRDELAKETTKYETVKGQLEGINKLGGDQTQTICDNEKLEKLEEVQNLLKAEKLKNEEYKKLLEETSEMNCLSPTSGVRKLRKEKIETENSLLEAKYKITSLETKTKDLEMKLKNAVNDKHEIVPSHDPLLQRKLNSVTAKLNDTENTNRSLIKEITELQSLTERLELDLKEERERRDVPVEKDIHRRSRASILQADPRLSISSPSTKMELTKTRERELCLKEQLTEANSKIQEWLAKLSDTENKLQLKTQELKYAQDTIQQLEARNCQEGRNVDKQIQEYMEQNNNLKLQILKKEGELECCQRSMQDLQRQLDSEVGLLKTFELDKKSQEEMITLLKDTLKEQEDMLQEQEDFLNSKEAELQTSQTEYKELLDKYHALVESNGNQFEDCKATVRIETERDLLKKQLEDIEIKLDSSSTEKDRLLSELKEKKSVAMETEKKLKKAVDEKEKLQAIIKENNQELKAMECTLTEARKEIEDLKSQGADKYSEIHLEEMKRDAEKSSHDLATKIRTLQCQNKELSFKLSATEEKVKSLLGEKHSMDNKLQEFREERDKLVSGLEAVLKKKDMEIKQHKDVIKQMKEKEIQLTQNWQSEREQIATGLQDLNEHRFKVKSEPPDTPVGVSPVKENICQRTDTPLTRASPQRGSRPPRPSPPRVSFPDLEESPTSEATEIQTLKSSPGSARRGSRSSKNTPGSETISSNNSSGRPKRGSSRRGKKRPSTDGLENLPPLPKRRSKDSFAETSNVSESDDYSSHLQVDATPPVAAKTLRRTRKKNGSQLDLSKAEETENNGRRTTRNKRTAKHRLLESFRESPMGRTSKRILDSIAETFSPKSPTRSPTKSPLREDNSGDYSAKGSRGSKDSVNSESQETDKKPSGRKRGRHKLYKEESYISEPFESTADFVQSPPEDIHKSVTRSLRSRRH